MSADSETLAEIANTGNPDRAADVVFVHGLGGGFQSTWRHGNGGEAGHFFWPEALSQDLPQCGIWSLGYEAGIVPWFGADGMPIEDRAVNLAHRLTTKGIGRRPLVFVTHSMGGLIVKEIVVQSITAGDPAWSQMVNHIAGIVFCATPHRGSHVATMVTRLATILRTQQHIRDMTAGERHLDRLHSRFVEWHRTAKPRIEAYSEAIGMKRQHWWLRCLPRLMIVDFGASDPQIAGCRCIPCNDDHLSIVKPRDRRHDVYAGVRRFVEETLAAVSGSASGPAADRNRETPSVGASDPGRIRALIIEILREEGLLPAGG